MPRHFRSALMEPLESRLLLTASPTNAETYMLALINRARANPTAEAAREGIDLNEGLAPGTISSTSKPPLAMNDFLILSARDHDTYMLTNTIAGGDNYFDHPETMGNPNFTGVDPGARELAQGYTSATTWGENIVWTGSTDSAAPDLTADTLAEYNDLFIDSTVAGRGHRINLLNASFREIGVGIETGPFVSGGTSYNSVVITNDFASKGDSTYFLTGIAYNDALVTADNFYEPGEGLGNITITATRTSDNTIFTTTTTSSGSYSLPLANGTYNITATGTGLGGTFVQKNVVINNANVEVDVTPAGVVQPILTVLGNSLPIANNDITITSADNTDFGFTMKNQPSISHTFVISNTGAGTLNFTAITLPSGFTSNFTTPVALAANHSFNLSITLATTTPGPKAGIVALATNDSLHNPFHFDVSGFIGDTFIAHLYTDILHRTAPTADIMYWTSQMVVSGKTPAQVASSIINSTERRTVVIQNLYSTILGRSADSTGLTYWLNFFATGGTIEQMESGFYGSQEYFDKQGDNIDTTVNSYYVAFLSRNGDSPGIAYWHNLIAKGTPRSTAALAILKSLEGRQKVVTRLYQTYLLRTPDTAGLNYWAAQLAAPNATEVSITITFLSSAEYVNRA